MLKERNFCLFLSNNIEISSRNKNKIVSFSQQINECAERNFAKCLFSLQANPQGKETYFSTSIIWYLFYDWGYVVSDPIRPVISINWQLIFCVAANHIEKSISINKLNENDNIDLTYEN